MLRDAGWLAANTSFRMPAKAVTITATYEDIPVTTYTVSFAANGGTGTMADVTGVSGEYTLPANGFTAPAGKQFKAWSVDGAEKAVGDRITVTADTTVTAVWKTISAGGNDNDVQSPQTGDNRMVLPWIALLFVSGLGLVAVTVFRKERYVR